MFHTFHFLQSDMVFGDVNSFSWEANAISSGKSCPISMPFLLTHIDVRTVKFFLPAECWLVDSDFPRKQYARRWGLLSWVWITSKSSKYTNQKQWKTCVHKKKLYTSVYFYNPGLALTGYRTKSLLATLNRGDLLVYCTDTSSLSSVQFSSSFHCQC